MIEKTTTKHKKQKTSTITNRISIIVSIFETNKKTINERLAISIYC